MLVLVTGPKFASEWICHTER